MELAVQKRDKTEKPDALRKRGMLPAVFYGPKEETVPVAIDAAVFEKFWRESGETTILSITGVGEPKEALIQEVAVHPVTGTPQHADLYVIERGKKVEVTVPIEFINEAPAEKLGHVINKSLHEIDITVRPSELPQQVEVDVSTLADVGDHITVSEIALPPSAELGTNPDEVVASVKETQEEPEEPDTATMPEEEAEGAGEESGDESGGDSSDE